MAIQDVVHKLLFDESIFSEPNVYNVSIAMTNLYTWSNHYLDYFEETGSIGTIRGFPIIAVGKPRRVKGQAMIEYPVFTITNGTLRTEPFYVNADEPVIVRHATEDEQPFTHIHAGGVNRFQAHFNKPNSVVILDMRERGGIWWSDVSFRKHDAMLANDLNELAESTQKAANIFEAYTTA